MARVVSFNGLGENTLSRIFTYSQNPHFSVLNRTTYLVSHAPFSIIRYIVRQISVLRSTGMPLFHVIDRIFKNHPLVVQNEDIMECVLYKVRDIDYVYLLETAIRFGWTRIFSRLIQFFAVLDSSKTKILHLDTRLSANKSMDITTKNLMGEGEEYYNLVDIELGEYYIRPLYCSSSKSNALIDILSEKSDQKILEMLLQLGQQQLKINLKEFSGDDKTADTDLEFYLSNNVVYGVFIIIAAAKLCEKSDTCIISKLLSIDYGFDLLKKSDLHYPLNYITDELLNRLIRIINRRVNKEAGVKMMIYGIVYYYTICNKNLKLLEYILERSEDSEKQLLFEISLFLNENTFALRAYSGLDDKNVYLASLNQYDLEAFKNIKGFLNNINVNSL